MVIGVETDFRSFWILENLRDHEKWTEIKFGKDK